VAAGAGSRILADSVGPGGTAAIVVFVLILACVVIILAMLGSLKRLKQSVNRGTFNRPQEAHRAKAQQARGQDPVTPDPGRDGEGA
jgi:hypothetical protein